MLWFIISVVIGFILGYFRWGDVDDGLYGALLGLLLGIIVFMVCA